MTQICLFITFFETKNAINDMLEPGKKPNTKFGAPQICEVHEKKMPTVQHLGQKSLFKGVKKQC